MTDTSREAVNRLIHWNIQSLETACALGLPIKDHPHEKCAMVLGEFLDERDRLRKLVTYLAGENTDHVQVHISGNPIVCDAVIAEARAALNGGEDDR